MDPGRTAGGSSALSENEAGPALRVCARVCVCVAGTSACRAHPDAELDSIQLPKWQIHSPPLPHSFFLYLSNCPLSPLSFSNCSLPLSFYLPMSLYLSLPTRLPPPFFRLSYLKSRLLRLKLILPQSHSNTHHTPTYSSNHTLINHPSAHTPNLTFSSKKRCLYVCSCLFHSLSFLSHDIELKARAEALML